MRVSANVRRAECPNVRRTESCGKFSAYTERLRRRASGAAASELVAFLPLRLPHIR